MHTVHIIQVCTNNWRMLLILGGVIDTDEIPDIMLRNVFAEARCVLVRVPLYVYVHVVH